MGKNVIIGGRIHNPEVGNVSVGANEVLDDTKGKKQNVINTETDAELLRLENDKQNNLTFDNTPTEDSVNPVTSGGVYAADAVLQQAIEAILILIPSAASSLNQLADKQFVNSSIATSTATFRGTYNLVSDLHLSVTASHSDIATALASVVSSADNQDYAFVQVPTSDTSSDIRVTERYKFNGEVWMYEYDLNNSGFTAQQWEAINSTITLALVQKLDALPTAAELATLLLGKQNVLTFDNVPTSGSDNPVKSGGLYEKFTAIDAKMPSDASADNKLVAENRLAAYVGTIIEALDASFNLTSADGHVTFRLTQADGQITSVQIATDDIASAAALTALGGRVSLNESDISNLQAAYAALTQSDIVIVNGALPSSGQQQNIIYRQPDPDHTPPQFYSDFMWNGTTWVLMATYNNAIDDEPTAGSPNLVKSGGVYALAAKKYQKASISSNIELYKLFNEFYVKSGIAEYIDYIRIYKRQNGTQVIIQYTISGSEQHLEGGDYYTLIRGKFCYLKQSSTNEVVGYFVLSNETAAGDHFYWSNELDLSSISDLSYSPLINSYLQNKELANDTEGKLDDYLKNFPISNNIAFNKLLNECYVTNPNNISIVSAVVIKNQQGLHLILKDGNGDPVAEAYSWSTTSKIVPVYEYNNSSIGGYVVFSNYAENIQNGTLTFSISLDSSTSDINLWPVINYYMQSQELESVIGNIVDSNYGYTKTTIGNGGSFTLQNRVISMLDSDVIDDNEKLVEILIKISVPGIFTFGIGYIDQNSWYIESSSFDLAIQNAGIQIISLKDRDIFIPKSSRLFVYNQHNGSESVSYTPYNESHDRKDRIIYGRPNEQQAEHATEYGAGMFFKYRTSKTPDSMFSTVGEMSNVINALESTKIVADTALSLANKVYDLSGNIYKLRVVNGSVVPISINYNSVIVLGNSVTIHNQTDLYGGNYAVRGLAATTNENDMAALIEYGLKQKNPNAKVYRALSSRMEKVMTTDTDYYDEWYASPSVDQDAVSHTYDLIIFRLSENANLTTNEDYSAFVNMGIALIQYWVTKNPNAEILVTSNVMGVYPIKDKALKEIANRVHGMYVSTNLTSADCFVVDSDWNYVPRYYIAQDSNKYPIQKAFCTHPNDFGMYNVANNVLKALGYNAIAYAHSVNVVSSYNYNAPTNGVYRGLFTVLVYDSIPSNITVTSGSGATIQHELINMSSVSYYEQPQRIPVCAIVFIMPNDNVTVTLS